MHRIDTPSAQTDKFGAGKNGFTNGDSSTGRVATQLDAEVFDAYQEELCSVIEAAGIALDKSNKAQLLAAIKVITGTLALMQENNLSDLTDVAAARENLQLGALATKDGLTASDVGAYPKTGGNLDEEASISVISNVKSGNPGETLYSPMFRAVLKGRGGDMDFKDGASGFMRIVENVGTSAYIQLQWDGFGSVQEFRFDQTGDFLANRNVHAGQGFLAVDGNVYGPVWGGYLSNWLNANFNNANQNVANQVNDVRNWTYQNFVNGIRLGGEMWQGSTNDSGGVVSLGGGEVLTGCQGVGGSDFNKAQWRKRGVQYLINGNWVQAGSL